MNHYVNIHTCLRHSIIYTIAAHLEAALNAHLRAAIRLSATIQLVNQRNQSR